MQKYPMTPEGYKKLQAQLKRLKSVERPKSIQAIEDARGHGDLSENAEYDAAKDHQLLISQQIKETEGKLAQAQVINPADLDHDQVVFGATVELRDIDSDNEVTYQIVGVDESDIKAGKISIESPLARGLMGKEAGEEVEVKTPKGVRTYELLKISFG